MSDLNNLLIAVDADGIDVYLNRVDDECYVNCGERLIQITCEQCESLERGDSRLLGELFYYDEFSMKV